MKMSLKTLIIASLAAMSLQASAALTNSELKIGISQEFENLNPLIMNMSATTYIYSMVGRTLTSMDANGKWVPLLAKSIPTLENGGAKLSADKKTLTVVWEILEKAKWSDGKPVVCADLKLARDIAESPNVSIAEKESYTKLQTITWDEKTPKKCNIVYDKPRWDFYMLGTTYLIPSHIEKDVFDKVKDQKEGYEKNSNYTKNPTMPGLYSGPYKISEVKLGSHVTLVPNEFFYGTAPKIQKIIVKLIPSTNTLESNLRSGTIDMIASLGLSFDQALAFEKKSKGDPFNTLFKTSMTYEHIDLNLENPILKDVKVRKALVYAINREELVKALFEGKQTAAVHNLNPIDPWYTADPKKITIYPYSRKDAARLLDEAGWKMNDKDGFRYKDGKKLSLQFMTTAGNKNRETVQTFLQGQWKAVGAEINIKNEPARVFFGDTTRKRAFGGMAMYAWTSSPENNPKAQTHSKEIPSEKNGWSGQNYVGWSNKRVDEITEKLEGEFDNKKRLALIHEFLKYYTDEVPVIPLYYRADVAVTPTKLQNFRLTGTQFLETNEVEKWNVQ